MACGLPIIAAKTGGIVDYVKQDNGILVDPGNVQQIKDAISKMKNSPEKIIEMGMKNRDKVVKTYTWQSVTDDYENIYNKLIQA